MFPYSQHRDSDLNISFGEVVVIVGDGGVEGGGWRNDRGKDFYCFLTNLIELRKEIWGSKNSLTPPKVQSAISSLPLAIKLF